ncbi:hypothetical protein Pcinc_030253 [Petrolisthes cinctipes]|uniref:Apple domain-containing protein n=1 Tax=Petrolisthes cinctipes TaxID=88211 RepID=A0AAE1EYS2_PETCI|nr:hypothetical protein Pcinc_030253 [Petrolisthes cinctipes]
MKEREELEEEGMRTGKVEREGGGERSGKVEKVGREQRILEGETGEDREGGEGGTKGNEGEGEGGGVGGDACRLVGMMSLSSHIFTTPHPNFPTQSLSAAFSGSLNNAMQTHRTDTQTQRARQDSDLRVREKNMLDKVCNRPWTFERVPNMMLRDLDNALIFTSSKEACLAACLNEGRFKCRSAEYNYVTLQCHLSQHDRRSAGVPLQMVETQGVDYFENLCLGASEACQDTRVYEEPELGVPIGLVSHYVDMHYYVDKELMANSDKACQRACEIENEFLCRSFLYKGPPTGTTYNCQLFHLDHFTLPDGPSTFLSTDRPLLDDGSRTGTYFENACREARDNMICKQVTTRDNRYITQVMCFDKATISRQVKIEGVAELGKTVCN